jgi:hypothetical protein
VPAELIIIIVALLLLAGVLAFMFQRRETEGRRRVQGTVEARAAARRPSACT